MECITSLKPFTVKQIALVKFIHMVDQDCIRYWNIYHRDLEELHFINFIHF